MEREYTEEDFKNIAKQLAKPEGAHGIKTGEMMNVSNIGMTHAAIKVLQLADRDVVLEIGHGNGGHVAHLLDQASGLKYFGADISETIVNEAKRINNTFLMDGYADFALTDGKTLPFENAFFDRIFTVNTIYFWEDPKAYLNEIKHVLKPSGKLVICFADKSFMQKLPFTSFGFTLYDSDDVVQLLLASGYQVESVKQEREQIMSNAGYLVDRDYHIISATI